MSRAAPGVSARGRLRRKSPEYLGESAGYSDRCWSKCPYRKGMEKDLHAYGNGAKKYGSFTLHLSGYGVGCGRLGEVVSLVGDCRPPPPGNPHRPTNLDSNPKAVSKQSSFVWQDRGMMHFSTKKRNFWGFFIPVGNHCSFNNTSKNWILKNIKRIEYFKVNRSSFYCTWKKPVLEFEHLYSHLCGSNGVEPLSIAITYVLET
jgi:hypothetical protein